MKKIIIGALFMLLGSFSIVSAEIGVNIGVSGTAGVFEGVANETEDAEVSKNEAGVLAVGWGSVFLEKTLPGPLSRIAIGVDYVPSPIESDTSTNAREDVKADADGASTSGNQKVQVDFSDLTTYYLTVNITDNFFVKAGAMEVDVVTNENLHTGSTYGNTSLDGTMYGAGYHKSLTNGFFFRAEANVMEFDGTTLNGSGDTKVTVNQLDGASGKLSIGKTF